MSIVPNGQNLFVIDIAYTVPFDEIEPHLDPHMDFVHQCYADGWFIASGAKEPRTGGVVIATGPSKQAIEDLMSKDPFTLANVVALSVTEFRPSNLVDALK